MKEWIVAFSLLGFGAFMTWAGINSIRYRWYESGISILEALLLNATGQRPVPRAPVDLLLARIQSWLAALFGPVCIFLGLTMLVA